MKNFIKQDWYLYVIGGIIGVMYVLFHFSFIWVVIILIVSSLVGINIDGAKTDEKVDKLEERIRDLENR